MIRKWQLAQHDLGIMILGMMMAALVRIVFVHGYNFPFWFDSARDAIVSREILENQNLKIQGPNASGTKDTVFHGVLYYYLIGSLYTLGNGDPQVVVYVLAFFSSLAIIPVYFLAKDLFQSDRTSLFAVILYALSAETTIVGTWLSNPIIATVTVPCFFYCLWRCFFRKDKKYWWPIAFLIGLSTQSVIFLIVLWFGTMVGFWYSQTYPTQKKLSLKLNDLLIASCIYLLTISSMILTQIRIYQAGLFHLENLSDLASQSIVSSFAIFGTLDLYLRKAIATSLPGFPVAAIILNLFAMITTLRNLEPKTKFFLLLIGSFPLWLLGWNYRSMYHLFIGFEVVIALFLAYWLNNFWQRNQLSKIIVGGFLITYVISNSRTLQLSSEHRASAYVLPQGAYLKDQLALIDETYKVSKGKPFSISTLTNPYGYNTSWAYLYSWYGQQKYHYLPLWFGPDQTGIFGGNLLTRVQKPESIHFTIYEPKEGIPEYIEDAFTSQQQGLVSTPSATSHLGTLRVAVYK